ncbi:DUF421 domain-containing protein [Mesorhizobium sp. KR9-304]|uniref:DUF421 domain-containing protein n=1 Tax=Mesorhizobium sp. KR9-304 TaxID=3156614 RepID=UPI0032B3BD37
MEEPVVAFDFGRMLLGDEPPLFLFEIAFRTVVIYVYTLALIRWIGSRSVGQLSLVEFLLVIALGSAVGDAMFYPDVPLVHCLVVITVVILIDKALSFLLARSHRLEDVIEGKTVELIRDGVIRHEVLRQANFGQDELFEQLRMKDIEHVGQVRAAYLETNGNLSVFKASNAPNRPGLSVEPPWDVNPPRKLKAGDSHALTVACAQCGTVLGSRPGAVLPACPRCASTTWHEAVA